MKRNKTLLEKAIELAVESHSGQKDKGGSPYILHPLRLMMKMDNVSEMIVAVLHDVVEDTVLTLDHLKEKGFSERELSAIDHLTRRKRESYTKFIKRVKEDPIAVRVKLVDIEDNLDIKRLNMLTKKAIKRLKKYRKSRKHLISSQGHK